MAEKTISQLMTRDDHRFLASLAGGNNTIRARYKRIFLRAMDQEPDPIKKNNAGRRAANIWLRENHGK